MLVALPAFAYARVRPLAWHAARFALRVDAGVRAQVVALAAWIAATFARTGNVLGYDSAWYGLRGELVLAPEQSLFDVTGLVSPVHYFPKLYELVLLPLNGLGTFQHAFALSTALLAIVALAAWRIARALGASEREAGWATLLVATLPVVASHGLTTKPELLALAMLLVAVRSTLALGASRTLEPALLSFAALALAAQARIGSGPFCAAIAVVTAVLLLRPRTAASARAGWLAIALAVVVSVALTARTLLLTGVPTVGPEPLLAAWQALGFTMHAPAGTLRWLQPQAWGDVPALVLDLLFRPAALSHVQVTWTGNAWLWCAAVLVGAGGAWRSARTRAAQAWLLAACAAAGIYLAIGQRYVERGGDGNYFMFAPVLALVFLVPAVLRRVRHPAVAAALVLFAAMQAWYAFTTAAWGVPGTRAWDLDFTRGPDRASEVRRGLWEKAGMLPLAAALEAQPRTLHLVGELPEVEGFLLPVRFEPLAHVYYSHVDRFASREALQELLDVADVDALVLPAEGSAERARVRPAVLEVFARWRADPRVRRRIAGDYELLVRPPRDG